MIAAMPLCRRTAAGSFLTLGLLASSIPGALAQNPFPASPAPPSREAMLKKFDTNQDGYLSGAEQAAMRQSQFEAKAKANRQGQGFQFRFPPEVIEKYDKDGDGELNEKESSDAREGIRQQWESITKEYDKNTNGTLDPEEMDQIRGAIESGKIKGIPNMFMGRPRGGRGGRGGGPWGGGDSGGATADRAAIMRNADANRDGRLNATELQAAREALAKTTGEAKTQP